MSKVDVHERIVHYLPIPALSKHPNKCPLSGYNRRSVNVVYVVNSVEKVSLLNFVARNRKYRIPQRKSLNQYSRREQRIGRKFRRALADRLFQQNLVESRHSLYDCCVDNFSRIFSRRVTGAQPLPRGYTPPRYHTPPPQNNFAIRTAVTFKYLEPWHRMQTTN